MKGALEALDATMKLAGPNTKRIPGHGTIINRTDIVPYRAPTGPTAFPAFACRGNTGG